MTDAEKEVLKTRSGRRCPARFRRCVNLIKWMKIHRIEGVVRKDFNAVLSKALDEPKYLLSRVYNFMDVERVGVLTEEDFDRLNGGYEGAANPATVDKFREWAYTKFGGLQGLWDEIRRLHSSWSSVTAEVENDLGIVDYEPFHRALQKLGWKGKPAEIFSLFNDHKPKTPYMNIDEFLLIDWLYLSQIERFTKWMMAKHGSIKAAFKAMDVNHSAVISLSEFRTYLQKATELSGLAHDDLERAFRWIDYNNTASITVKEFQLLASFDATKFTHDLSTFRRLMIEKWGSFYDAFSNMSSIQVSDKKARLSKQARETKKQGIRFVCLEQFTLAAKELQFTPTHDLQLIFRYLDFNFEGTIVLEDFMVLPVATIVDTRECFSKVKAYLIETYGSCKDSYAGLSHAASILHEEERNVPPT